MSEMEHPGIVQNNNDSYLESMPPELIHHVLDYLDLKDLQVFSKTSLSLNGIVTKYETLWRKHCLALTDVSQSDIWKDHENGYTWKQTFEKYYEKSKCNQVKEAWKSGKFSNIQSYSELPEMSMHPLSAEDWGEILDAELER
uniref:F-box domain-containing protein n=1 Tax=Leptobrachium leishanense TaxID=445787 RepID=A0A8C5PBX7_9ANUR